MSHRAEVVLEEQPAHVVNGPFFLAEHNDGQAIIEIARTSGCHWQAVLETISYAATGLIPDVDNDSPERFGGWERFEEFGDEVRHLRDNQEMEWIAIVERFKELKKEPISINAILRAYEHSHGRFSGNQKRMYKSPLRRSGKFQEFQKLIVDGAQNLKESSQQIGISERTAYRWKKRILKLNKPATRG